MATTTTSTESKIRCTHDRIKSMKLTFASDQTGGTWDYLNNTVGLVPADVDVSEQADGAFYYEIEDVIVPKTTGQTWSPGDQLYYDVTNDKFANAQNTSAGHKKAGDVLASAGTAATEGEAHLIGDQHRR